MKTKIFIAASVLAVSSVASSVALAEVPLTANIGVTSNYIWRGQTLSKDLSAVQGGVDYVHDSGFYAGTWTSSLFGGDYELDIYAGYSMSAGPVDLDFGALSYQYPVPSTYYREAYINGSWNFLNFGGAYTFASNDDDTAEYSQGDVYAYVGVAFELKKDLAVGATYGVYNFKNAGDDYGHIQLTLSKDDFTVALDKNNREGPNEDKVRFTVSWSKSLDLM